MKATAPHILVVDDEPEIRELALTYLRKNGMRVSACGSGQEMFALFEKESIDLVLLDLTLQGEDGMQLARSLRDRAPVPIVMLTGRSEEADRVMGLELGADDYVTKPFSPRELLARLRAVLRRYQDNALAQELSRTARAFRFSGWELNLRTRRLMAPDGALVKLTNGEFSLLSALCHSHGRVLSRDQLLSMSRLHQSEVFDRTVDVQIRRLRLKLGTRSGDTPLIVTVRGAGYLMPCFIETLY